MSVLSERAARVLTGGVSAGWNYLLDGPRFFADARGAHLIDADRERWIDFITGWGSLLLGHDPEPVRAALERTLSRGFLHQYETELHVELAERICALVPCAERVRLANSGTEATMHALRIARAATGRPKILKFEGHFHGLHDSVLFSHDSSPRLGEQLPDGEIEPVAASAGVPDVIRELCVVVPFNDVAAFDAALARHRGELAAVIVEPIAFNMGCVSPDDGFHRHLRDACTRDGIVLVFDEVLTGFRVAPGGAQQLFDVLPDLVCLGKALGCGMPIAAVAGRRELMDLLSPPGPVEMSGTNTGRILTVAGSLAALDALAPAVYRTLDELQSAFIAEARAIFAEHGVPVWIEGYGGRIGIYVGLDRRPRNLRDIVAKWDRDLHLQLHLGARARRLYGFLNPLPWSPEAITFCAAHTRDDLAETLTVLRDVVHAACALMEEAR